MKIRKDGYKYVYMPSHPRAHKDGYIAEHRIVAEQTLGRLLEPKEVVHHKDENPSNNDPANLEVFPSVAEHQAMHRAQMTEEEREADRQKRKGRKASPEARAKMSAARMGNQYRKGIPHTAETKAKISAIQTGKKRGPYPEAWRKAISDGLKGRDPSTFRRGFKNSEATRRKISEAAIARAARKRAERDGPAE